MQKELTTRSVLQIESKAGHTVVVESEVKRVLRGFSILEFDSVIPNLRIAVDLGRYMPYSRNPQYHQLFGLSDRQDRQNWVELKYTLHLNAIDEISQGLLTLFQIKRASAMSFYPILGIHAGLYMVSKFGPGLYLDSEGKNTVHINPNQLKLALISETGEIYTKWMRSLHAGKRDFRHRLKESPPAEKL